MINYTKVVNRYIEETREAFGDSSHILYVNGAYRGDTPLGLLMKDFSCKVTSDMHYKKLADRVRYFEEDEDGVNTMSGIVEELMEEFIDDEKYSISNGGFLGIGCK